MRGIERQLNLFVASFFIYYQFLKDILQKFNITNLPKSEQNIQFNNLTFNVHPPFVHFNFELREEHTFRDPLTGGSSPEFVNNFQLQKDT